MGEEGLNFDAIISYRGNLSEHLSECLSESKVDSELQSRTNQ